MAADLNSSDTSWVRRDTWTKGFSLLCLPAPEQLCLCLLSHICKSTTDLDIHKPPMPSKVIVLKDLSSAGGSILEGSGNFSSWAYLEEIGHFGARLWESVLSFSSLGFLTAMISCLTTGPELAEPRMMDRNSWSCEFKNINPSVLHWAFCHSWKKSVLLSCQSCLGSSGKHEPQLRKFWPVNKSLGHFPHLW